MNKEITTTKIAIFRKREIRKTIHNKEWWFVVEDVVLALTDSSDPKQYIQRMKQRDGELAKGWVQIVHTLSVDTAGGKQQMICANTEGIFRIIQSIPSPKAEPFKRWLARVGYERIQEIENPELATKRTRALYKATFGMTPFAYKKHKGLKRGNLRDHMNDLELIFSMLGEASTKEISVNKDAQGFVENKQAAFEGGAVAGNARKELERKSGKKVITKEIIKSCRKIRS